MISASILAQVCVWHRVVVSAYCIPLFWNVDWKTEFNSCSASKCAANSLSAEFSPIKNIHHNRNEREEIMMVILNARSTSLNDNEVWYTSTLRFAKSCYQWIAFAFSFTTNVIHVIRPLSIRVIQHYNDLQRFSTTCNEITFRLADMYVFSHPLCFVTMSHIVFIMTICILYAFLATCSVVN